jgi:hypothetical protein
MYGQILFQDLTRVLRVVHATHDNSLIIIEIINQLNIIANETKDESSFPLTVIDQYRIRVHAASNWAGVGQQSFISAASVRMSWRFSDSKKS